MPSLLLRWRRKLAGWSLIIRLWESRWNRSLCLDSYMRLHGMRGEAAYSEVPVPVLAGRRGEALVYLVYFNSREILLLIGVGLGMPFCASSSKTWNFFQNLGSATEAFQLRVTESVR